MLDWFRKKAHAARIDPAGMQVEVAGGAKLLDAALEAGLAWPHDCRVGSCGTCRCRLREGTTKALIDFTYTLSQQDIADGYILACQSRLRSDVVVEVTLDEGEQVATEIVTATVTRCTALTHDIVMLELALERTAFTGMQAGQYLDVSHADLPEPRSYSIARAPRSDGSDAVTFFIRHVPGGAFTDWLFDQDRSGATLTLNGPFGRFYRRDAVGPMLMIAGGSGLAPIHAVLEAAVEAGIERDCTVLFGARSQRDLYYLDELAALGRRWHGNWQVIPVLSDEPADSDWQGARGLVTALIAAVTETAFDAEGQAYLCGPPGMIDAAIAALRGAGVADDRIFFDKFLDASTQPGGRAAIDGTGASPA